MICLIRGGKEFIFEGRVDGVIAKERHGSAGFGYDPVFIPLGHTQSFAEMDAVTKNRISHRGQASAEAHRISQTRIKMQNGKMVKWQKLLPFYHFTILPFNSTEIRVPGIQLH